MKSEHAKLIAALGQLGTAVAQLIQLSVKEQIPTVGRIPPEVVSIPQAPVPQAQHAQPMTKQEVATFFGVTSRTVDSWMSVGLLPYWKIGHLVRFDMEAVKAALKTRRRGSSFLKSQ
jgi:excisionase family DNA binding protein